MQFLVGGIILGCIYGLIALGLVLIYKTTDIVNFAHGEMAMVSTFVSFVLLTEYELPYFVAFILALLFSGILGAFIYQVIMKRIQSSPHLNQIVVTFGLFLILNGLAGLIWGNKPTGYPVAIEGSSFQVLGVYITPNEVFIVMLTIVLMLIFYLFFRFSKIGLAMRTAAQDIMASRLMGIKVTNIYMVSWIVGGMLGAIAGMMTAPITFLDTHMMLDVLIMAFAAAVLGGFVSLPGVVIGGLIIGIFGSLINFYIGPEMKVVYTFLLIIVVLYIRPQGIFGGAKEIKKV